MFSYDKRFNDIETLELQEGLARAFNTTIYCLAGQRSEPKGYF